MLYSDSSHPIVTRGSRVSSAPPHHNLPTFLNLHFTIRVKGEPPIPFGTIFYLVDKKVCEVPRNGIFPGLVFFIGKFQIFRLVAFFYPPIF